MKSEKRSKLHFFNLAVKNLLLYKQRTILTFLILSFGIMLYIVMDGMLVGMTDEAIKTLIDMKTGDIQIYAADYDKEEYFTIYTIDDNSVESVLKDDPNIKAYAKRINFTAMVEFEYSMMPISVYGVDYSLDSKVLKTLDYVKSSRNMEYFAASMQPYAFLGYSLAEQMKLKEGDWILLTLRTKDGMYNSMYIEIGGLIKSPEPTLNASSIIVPYLEAAAALAIDKPTQYIVKTHNYAKAEHYRKVLSKSLPNLKINYWLEEGKEFIQISEMKQKYSSFFILFVLIIAVIGIVNTMIMSVFEKIREIGTMKALGFHDKEIGFVFSFEGLLLGFFGSFTGVVLAAFINWYFVAKGMDYGKMVGPEVLGSMGFPEILHSSWNIWAYIGSLVSGTFVSYIATLSTSRRAARLDAAKALRTI